MKKLGLQADGAFAFGFEMSESYKSAEKEFVACVSSNHPNTLVILLQKYGFHAGALLQLATLSQKSGQFEQAYDLLQRALYFYERCLGASFRFDDSSVRLPFAHKENQGLHVVLFRWIAMQGRKGCTRTALECCKLLLNWDPNDPLDVLLMIDYFALRSMEYEWLISVYRKGVAGKKVSFYPNLAFGAAFSLFYLKDKYALEEAERELVCALKLFPECVEKVFGDLNVAGEWRKSLLFSCSRGPAPLNLQNTMKIYCQRSKDMFRAKVLQEWICKVLAKKELFEECTAARDEMVKQYRNEQEV